MHIYIASIETHIFCMYWTGYRIVYTHSTPVDGAGPSKCYKHNIAPGLEKLFSIKQQHLTHIYAN